MLEQSKVIGEWLAAQGYGGTASIDFQIVVRDKKTEVRACEINARVTGATYPSILAKHFRPKHTWLMRNIRFQSPLKGATILEKMKGAGILFHKDSSEGVLPFNFNAHKEDQVIKAQVLFLAESLKKTRALLDRMNSLFTLKGDYDRD